MLLSFLQNMEIRCWNLNPEAPEFLPARNALVSDPNCPIFPPTEPNFLYYQAPTSLHSHAFSAAPFTDYPSYPYPHQHAAQGHFLIPVKAAVLVTEPVSSLLESFKTRMVVEEAQEPRVVARKENVGGVRRRYRDKHHWRNKRYGKEGFVRADTDNTHASKKECRVEPGSYITGDNKQFVRNTDQGWAENNNRERYPLIPLKSDGKETAVMIRNIPNRYTREMLKEFLDQHCMLTNRGAESQNASADEEPSLSAFDFLYLPIDFVTKSNKGYAFVNFTNAGAARKLFESWHHKHWDCFKSNKIREIYCAKLQGVEQLVKHFERMKFPSQDFQPVCFSPARDGSKQSVEETVVGRCASSRCSKSPNLIS